MKYETIVLDNGLQVILGNDNNCRYSTMSVMYKVNSGIEHQAKYGIRHVIDKLFGSSINIANNKSYKCSYDLNGIIENGSYINNDCFMLYSGFPNNQLETMLSLEAVRLRYFLNGLNNEIIKFEKNKIINEILEKEKWHYSIRNILHNMIYPAPHVYYGELYGTAKDIESITFNDLVEIYNNYYIPSSVSMVIIGSFNTKKIRECIRKYYDTDKVIIKNNKAYDYTNTETTYKKDYYANLARPILYMAWKYDSIYSKEYYLTRLIDVLLNDSKNGLLRKIAENNKINHLLFQDKPMGSSSYFAIEALVNNNNEIDNTAHEILCEINKIVKRQIKNDELSHLKNICKKKIIVNYETMCQDTININKYEYKTGKVDYINNVLQKIDDIKTEELQDYLMHNINSDKCIRLNAYKKKTLSSNSRITDHSEILRIRKKQEHKLEPYYPDRWRVHKKENYGIEKCSIPEYDTFMLPNKMKIYLLYVKNTKMVHVSYVCKAGLRSDNVQKVGISGLVNHLLTEIIQEYANNKKYDIEYMFTNIKDGSSISCYSHKQEFNNIIKTYSHLLNNQKITYERFNIKRIKMIEALKANMQHPIYIAYQIMQDAVFGCKHQYGYWNYGSTNSLSAINIEDIKKYVKSYYTPDNSAMVIVGNVTRKKVEKELIAYIDKWLSGKHSKLPAAEVLEKDSEIILFDMPWQSNATILFGHRIKDPNTKEAAGLFLLNQILNDNLKNKLQIEKGYVNNIYSDFTCRIGEGLFSIEMQTKAENAYDVYMCVMETIKKVSMQNENIYNINFYKTKIKNDLNYLFKDNISIMKNASKCFVYDKKDNYYNSLIAKIELIRKVDLSNLAEKYLIEDKLKTVAVGPNAIIKKQFQKRRLKIEIMTKENYSLN